MSKRKLSSVSDGSSDKDSAPDLLTTYVMSGFTSVEKATWLGRTKRDLVTHGLWEFVSAEEEKPLMEWTGKVSDDMEQARKVSTWISRDAQARGILEKEFAKYPGLKPLWQEEQCDTAQKMWKWIRKHFDVQGNHQGQLELARTLYGIKYDHGGIRDGGSERVRGAVTQTRTLLDAAEFLGIDTVDCFFALHALDKFDPDTKYLFTNSQSPPSMEHLHEHAQRWGAIRERLTSDYDCFLAHQILCPPTIFGTKPEWSVEALRAEYDLECGGDHETVPTRRKGTRHSYCPRFMDLIKCMEQKY